MLRLPALISQAQALNLRVVAASGDVAADDACRTVADWVAPRTRTDQRAAYAQEKLAQALDERWQQVAGALADGRVHLDQARVIVKALDALPAEIRVEVRRLAEQRLVADADQFGPTDLARLGRRVLDVIAPEVGDEQERRALERPSGRPSPSPGSTSSAAATAYTDIPPPSRRGRSPADRPTSRPSPPRRTAGRATASTRPPASGCPPTGNAARRSARCSNASTPPSCPTTAAWPPP